MLLNIKILNSNKKIINETFKNCYKKIKKIIIRNELNEIHNWNSNITNEYIKIETNEFERHDFNI